MATSTGVSVTGATVTVLLSKAGAAFAAPVGAVTEIANGFYYILLGMADVGTLGDLSFYITSTGGSGTSVPVAFVDQVSTYVMGDLNIDSNGNVAINSSVKKNQASNGFMFMMTNSTTHAPQTGLIVTAQRSLAGAGFAPCANSVTELSNGIYSINLAASDVNASSIMFRFTSATADDLNILIMTQP